MQFDVAVVGAGSAGVALAARLSEDPAVQVVLIEAGPDFTSWASTPDSIRYFGDTVGGPLGDERTSTWPTDYDWNFTARATDERRMNVPRGRVTGGTSAINGAVFVRGTREDFDSWVAAGNPEWSYEKVLPYYRKLETDLDFQDEYHGSDGPIRVSRAPREAWGATDVAFEEASVALGYPTCADHNHPDSTGVGPIPKNTQDGTRVSSARAYLTEARSRPNLTIMADTVVRRLVFAGSRAVGVEIANQSGSIVRADEVVLSAGAIKTPHLLLLSGLGPAAQLSRFGIPVVADLPGVGRNLRDHPSVMMLWARDDRGIAAGEAPVGMTYLRFTAPGSPVRNDSRIMSPGSAATEGHPERANIGSMFAGLYLASGRGHLGLRSADPDVSPDIDYRYLDEESDRRRMRQIVTIARGLAEEKGLASLLGTLVEPTPADFLSDSSLDAWMRRRVRTAHHPSSTAKLGPESDPEAVVNQFLQVHGVENLRVADASVMPDCVSHNTNKTSTMIGERAADFVRNR